jgi:hypothetical protein
MSGLIRYITDDGQNRIQLRADGQTVRLTQLEMAEGFAATKQNISLHLKNIFGDSELADDSVVKDSLTVKPRANCTRIPLSTAARSNRDQASPSVIQRGTIERIRWLKL